MGARFRTTLLLVLACLLVSDLPDLRLPPRSFPTPNCQTTLHTTEAGLVASVADAPYECAEELAAALKQTASDGTMRRLLRLADGADTSLARRNALRILGRLAGQPHGWVASWFTLGARAERVRAVIVRRLRSDQHNEVLHEAIWLADTAFFPWFAVQPDLAALSADPAREPAIRARAAAAIGRMIFVKPGILPAADREWLLAALQSPDDGVRAQAALICQRLRDEQIDPAVRRRLVGALDAAWDGGARALQLPELSVTTTIHVTALRSALEQAAATVLASANLARALDRLAGGARFAGFRAAYEAAYLPNQISAHGMIVRSALPTEQLEAITAALAHSRATFLDWIGPELGTPLPGDANPTLTIFLFGDQAAYRGYLAAFADVPFEVDGIYTEAQGRMYTFQRNPGQTANSLEASLQHEFGHYLAGRYIFPGSWFDAEYHNEPKGWADEGLAEMLAGLANSTSQDAAAIPPRYRTALCQAAAHPSLASLLARRAGYDQFGTFDYPYAWAFSSYLVNERRDVLVRLYRSYRDQHYRLDAFAQIAGVPSLAVLEADWYAAIDRWCRQ